MSDDDSWRTFVEPATRHPGRSCLGKWTTVQTMTTTTTTIFVVLFSVLSVAHLGTGHRRKYIRARPSDRNDRDGGIMYLFPRVKATARSMHRVHSEPRNVFIRHWPYAHTHSGTRCHEFRGYAFCVGRPGSWTSRRCRCQVCGQVDEVKRPLCTCLIRSI